MRQYIYYGGNIGSLMNVGMKNDKIPQNELKKRRT